MHDPSSPTTRMIAWAQLVRLPNVFTVLADVAAAFVLVSGGAEPWPRLVCVLLAGVALYWAGMVLNDVMDIDVDRQERSSRPLAAGRISLFQAKLAGWGLLAVGVVLATTAGYLPSSLQTLPLHTTWLPGAIGLALAVMIVAYDGPLKKTPLAPAAMGSCRVLSFLLGASPCLMIGEGGPIVPNYVLALALGFGVYIMGITTMARREAVGGRDPNLAVGLVVLMVGVAAIAFAPRTMGAGLPFRIDPAGQFPILVGLISFPVILRGLRVLQDPSPLRIQSTIKVGVLSIIPLASAVAVLGAGPIYGLAVFALVIPAIVLASRLRVT